MKNEDLKILRDQIDGYIDMDEDSGHSWVGSLDPTGPYYGGPFRVPIEWRGHGTSLAIASEVHGVNLWAWAQSSPQFRNHNDLAAAKAAGVLEILE